MSQLLEMLIVLSAIALASAYLAWRYWGKRSRSSNGAAACGKSCCPQSRPLPKRVLQKSR